MLGLTIKHIDEVKLNSYTRLELTKAPSICFVLIEICIHEVEGYNVIAGYISAATGILLSLLHNSP